MYNIFSEIKPKGFILRRCREYIIEMRRNKMVLLCTALMFIFAILWVITFVTKLAGGKNILANNFQPKSEEVTRKEIVKVFLYALIFRIGIYIAGVAIAMIFSDDVKYSFSDFLAGWNRWDSQHYIELAQKGYANCIENGQHLFLVFFPLCPWLLKIVHFLVRDWQIAFLTLSTLTYCVGAVFFYLTVSQEYGKRTAEKALVLVSVWPFAFFFGGMMTESLFFMTLSIGFYFIKKHNWLAVGITGIFCSLCRVQGILLLGVAGVEFLETYSPVIMWKEKKIGKFFKEVFTKGIFLLLIPVGNLIYFYLNYKVEGDPFKFQEYQKDHWYHEVTNFNKGFGDVWRYLTDAGTTNSMKMSVWLPEVLIVVLMIIVLFCALKTQPLKYTAYLWVYTMVCYGVTFLISGGRYMLCALPLFIIAGNFLENHEKLYQLVVVLSTVFMMVFMAGYFNGKQIM